jgi:membrane protein required for colicin V production
MFLSYAALFVAALVIGGIVTWLVGRLMKSSGLGGIDRLLGLVFGLVRGMALACMLVLLFGFTAMPQDAWWHESRLLPQFQLGAQAMKAWLPDAVAPYVQFDGVAAGARTQAPRVLPDTHGRDASPRHD